MRHNGKPGDDPSGYTLAGAQYLSRNCPKCDGGGLATIYNPNYAGVGVGYEFDHWGNRQQIVMRTTAYCLCPAGRKVMMLNQSSNSPPVMYDIHDVIAGKYHNWVVDDPTYDPNQPLDIESLPPVVRRIANASGVPRIHREPEEPNAAPRSIREILQP